MDIGDGGTGSTLMKTIYHVWYEDEFEADGFYDDKGVLLQWWMANDAEWRQEYMGPLLEAIGFEVKPAPLHLKKKFAEYMETV